MAEWMIRRGEQEFTAPGVSRLQLWHRNGLVVDSDLVLHPNLQQWMYARDLAELRQPLDVAALPCPFCGEYALRYVKGLQGTTENAIGLFWAAMCLIPLLLYYIPTTKQPYCTNCHKRAPLSRIA